MLQGAKCFLKISSVPSSNDIPSCTPLLSCLLNLQW